MSAPWREDRLLHSKGDGEGRAAAALDQHLSLWRSPGAPQRAAASRENSASMASTAAFAAATALSSLPRTTLWLLKRPPPQDEWEPIDTVGWTAATAPSGWPYRPSGIPPASIV